MPCFARSVTTAILKGRRETQGAGLSTEQGREEHRGGLEAGLGDGQARRAGLHRS